MKTLPLRGHHFSLISILPQHCSLLCHLHTLQSSETQKSGHCLADISFFFVIPIANHYLSLFLRANVQYICFQMTYRPSVSSKLSLCKNRQIRIRKVIQFCCIVVLRCFIYEIETNWLIQDLRLMCASEVLLFVNF